MFEFQKLEVYKKAKIFHIECREVIENTKLENYVRDQLGRASFSVALNIAEGSGKFSKMDRRNYFVISRGSIFECIAILDILHDRGIVKKENFERMNMQADELSRMLFAMIKNLSSDK
jgi:four helix bundle protein